MRKEYRSSNVRFCMDDENQRRTWEYLQSITRKEGSYGKILSDAFVQILDGNHAIEQEALQQNLSECVTEKMLSMQLSTLKREDRKSTRLNSSHNNQSRMPSSA